MESVIIDAKTLSTKYYRGIEVGDGENDWISNLKAEIKL